MATHWITQQDAVRISDLERTLIDGLRQPEYWGGIHHVCYEVDDLAGQVRESVAAGSTLVRVPMRAAAFQ